MVRDVSKYPFTSEGINVFNCVLPDNINPKGIENVDVLIHSAYMTRYTNLEDAVRVNESGTSNLYKAAHNTGVKKFVFISSRAARQNARSYYAQSKFRIESKMDVSSDLIVRPGLILASDGGLFSRIVNQVKSLPVVPVFGDGLQRLNTVHIDDVCKVIDWALEKNISGIITVAETEGITMKELLRAVLRQLGGKKPIVSVPGKPIVLFLQLLESLKLKLPVSSENLRGLLNRDEIESLPADNLNQSGIKIRGALESIKSLISNPK
jgi:nucleoside-diphosphate-sugar epimerase